VLSSALDAFWALCVQFISQNTNICDQLTQIFRQSLKNLRAGIIHFDGFGSR